MGEPTIPCNKSSLGCSKYLFQVIQKMQFKLYYLDSYGLFPIGGEFPL